MFYKLEKEIFYNLNINNEKYFIFIVIMIYLSLYKYHNIIIHKFIKIDYYKKINNVEAMVNTIKRRKE